MNVKLEDLRGFGITASKLSAGRSTTNGNALGTWLSSAAVVSPSKHSAAVIVSPSKKSVIVSPPRTNSVEKRKRDLSSISLSSVTTSTPPKWKCKRCTYANSYFLPYCEMCEKEKKTPNGRKRSSNKAKRTSTAKKRKSATRTQITLTQLDSNSKIRTSRSNDRNNIIQAVPLTMSQIDQNTLSELPRHLQDEIRSSVVISSSSRVRPLETKKRWTDIEHDIKENLEREDWLIRTGSDMIADTNLDDLQTMLRFLEYNMPKQNFDRVLNAIQDKFRVLYAGASFSYK